MTLAMCREDNRRKCSSVKRGRTPAHKEPENRSLAATFWIGCVPWRRRLAAEGVPRERAAAGLLPQ
jgi:hypothetical protein